MFERKAKEMEFIVREKTVDDSTVSFEMTDPNGNEVGNATMRIPKTSLINGNELPICPPKRFDIGKFVIRNMKT